MAQRTECLYKGKIIGIETIFTVINGKQINIEEKVEELRAKSRNNELFCPCGCGANLVLVAGDKQLREQHFRLKDNANKQQCNYVSEGRHSIESKIVLKCWLDDKIENADIKTRVPVSSIYNTNCKCEFTVLSVQRKVAISYNYNRRNLLDEKIDALENNGKKIKIIYIVDNMNSGGNGQYPENLIKVQERQGFCLYLSLENSDYNEAKLRAVVYMKNIDGLWKEIEFACGKLYEFGINNCGDIEFKGKTLSELKMKEEKEFKKHIDEIKLQREKKRIEDEKNQQEESMREEYKRQIELQRLEENDKKNKAMLEEKKRIEDEETQENKWYSEEEINKIFDMDFEKQETQIRDVFGNRWIKCEFCGKIAKEEEFVSYGGDGHINLGKCNKCSKNNVELPKQEEKKMHIKKKVYNSDICPECGGKLLKRNGRFGVFIGCSNYPRCKYSRKGK